MITIISGTNREGSNTLKVARILHGLYGEAGAEARLLDLRELPTEVFNPGVYGDKPESFQPFIDQILSSDGVSVVIPEYNGSFPGVLKYFIDLLPFPESFDLRPVSYVGISAGQFGGLRPVEQLQMIYGYRNAHNYPARVFIPGVGKQLDEDGNLKDPDLLERLRNQCTGFLGFVSNLKG